MKSKNKGEPRQYSIYFNNKIIMPPKATEALCFKERIIERISILDYRDPSSGLKEGEKNGTISIEIFASTPFVAEDGEVLCGEGYFLKEDWDGIIWYAETYSQVQTIINDYKRYIKERFLKHWSNLKILRWREYSPEYLLFL